MLFIISLKTILLWLGLIHRAGAVQRAIFVVSLLHPDMYLSSRYRHFISSLKSSAHIYVKKKTIQFLSKQMKASFKKNVQDYLYLK